METFSPRQYLFIDIANAFGLDKKDWSERIKWVQGYYKEDPSLQSLLDPYNLKRADDPAAAYAAILAYQKMMLKQPSGHTIKLDATASGLQLLACVTGDRSAAELCNVIDTGSRKDAYTIIHDSTKYLCEQENIRLPNIERADSKQALMTALYGSTAMPKQVYGDGPALMAFYYVVQKFMPAAWRLNEALVAMWPSLPGSGSDPQNLTNHWTLPDNFHVRIKVMDSEFEVFQWEDPAGMTHQNYVKIPVHKPVELSRSLGANIIHSIDGMVVREITRRCNYDPDRIEELKMLLGTRGPDDSPIKLSSIPHTEDSPEEALMRLLWAHYETTGYLSARIFDCLSGGTWNAFLMISRGQTEPLRELLSSLPAKPFHVISIHDAFRCHPNYVTDMRKQYNYQLMEIARSTIMDSIVTQLMDRTSRPIKLNKLDPDLWKEIKDANYALS